MKRFIAMLTFYTRMPIPKNMVLDTIDFEKSLGYVPIVGLLIGLVMYGMGYLFTRFSTSISSVLLVIVYLFVTGGLHIDGLADTLDAFGSNRPREKMLEIMKDSHVGSFGVLGIVMWFASLAVLLGEVPLFALLLFPLVGRNAALLVASTNNYARKSGLGSIFVEAAKMSHFMWGTVLYMLVLFLLYGFELTALLLFTAYLLSMIVIFILLSSMGKKLGGVTGDLIGFAIESSQLVFLLLVYITVLP
ncbi:adenosylcobinamide-GDP ribazoletransferase [Clostridia bacterium]|nr:adenosylcobinamide-GDP ribazoletransferase [Clostridia bacterium]